MIGTAFSRSGNGLEKLDLTERDRASSFVKELKPDVILHCAAERRPDNCENKSDLTRKLNVNSTSLLAKCAKNLNSWMIYLSTDYVFDGSTPPYHPHSPTNPLNKYGLSKRDGEDAVLNTNKKAAVLRVPILYGDVEDLDESAITVILGQILAAEGQDVTLDDWATRYPTLTDDVAVVCREMIEHHIDGEELGGIFHWAGDEAMSKYSMGKEMAGILKISSDKFISNQSPPSGTPRPKNCHLDCSVLEKAGIGRRTPFVTAMKKIMSRLKITK